MTVRDTPSAKKSAAAKKQKRRSPISREEGERRLATAALQLIQTRPFSEVSVRDIAEVADVNHGFVHTWFGSKNDLLARVARYLLHEVTIDLEKEPPGEPTVGLFDDRIQLAVRLLMWLHLEGYDPAPGMDMAIFETLRTRYREVEGLTEADADTAAATAIALGIGIGTFSPIVKDIAKVDLGLVFPMWRHVLGLLAKHPYQ